MPNNSFPPDDPFHTTDPLDGYHSELIERTGRIVLTVQARFGGEPLPNPHRPGQTGEELLDLTDPTPAQAGHATRLDLLLSAMCRFLNTGGKFSELDELVRALDAVGGVRIATPGYHYLTTHQTDDGDQHVFVKNDATGEAALWQTPARAASGGLVGGWIEKTTLDQILEDQADDDAGWGGPRTVEAAEAEAGGAAEGAGHPAPLQLPARPGDRPADADQGRGDPGVPPHDPGRPAG